MSTTETKTDSGVVLAPDLVTRYRLAEAQLAVLPPVDEDDAEEWSGLRFQCEEVMELIERLSRVEAELEQWKTWGIVEIAVRNPAVAEYMEHWEGRATKAEAELARLRWQPISAENLPKVGDNVLLARNIRGTKYLIVENVPHPVDAEYQYWVAEKYTHFLPINPPKETA